MPKKLVGQFDWYNSKAPGAQCVISIGEGRMSGQVYIDEYQPDRGEVKHIYFRREELQPLIKTLQEAQRILDESGEA